MTTKNINIKCFFYKYFVKVLYCALKRKNLMRDIFQTVTASYVRLKKKLIRTLSTYWTFC